MSKSIKIKTFLNEEPIHSIKFIKENPTIICHKLSVNHIVHNLNEHLDEPLLFGNNKLNKLLGVNSNSSSLLN
jgi:hypothetical protein